MQPIRCGNRRAPRLRCDDVDRRTERWLLLTFCALIILTVAVEVIRRFALNYSSVWGEELARYAFIYLAWLHAELSFKIDSGICPIQD